MNAKHDPKAPQNDADPRLPRKTFRIQKLEERIAPKKGGNGTNNCGGGSSASGTGACSTSGSIF